MASRIAVEERVVRQARASEEAGVDPAFPRAILKIALELKKPNAASYEAIVATTIRNSGLSSMRPRRTMMPTVRAALARA